MIFKPCRTLQGPGLPASFPHRQKPARFGTIRSIFSEITEKTYLESAEVCGVFFRLPSTFSLHSHDYILHSTTFSLLLVLHSHDLINFHDIIDTPGRWDFENQ